MTPREELGFFGDLYWRKAKRFAEDTGPANYRTPAEASRWLFNPQEKPRRAASVLTQSAERVADQFSGPTRMRPDQYSGFGSYAREKVAQAIDPSIGRGFDQAMGRMERTGMRMFTGRAGAMGMNLADAGMKERAVHAVKMQGKALAWGGRQIGKLAALPVPAAASITGRPQTQSLAMAGARGMGRGLAKLATTPLTLAAAAGTLALGIGAMALRGTEAIAGGRMLGEGGMFGTQLAPRLQAAGGIGMVGAGAGAGYGQVERGRRGSWQMTTGAGGLPEMERSDFMGATGSLAMAGNLNAASSPFGQMNLRAAAPALADDAVMLASRLMLRR